MSDVEIQPSDAVAADELQGPREPAAPIESRFLFVDVAALRAKQLRRGAKLRLPEPGTDGDHTPHPHNAERLAMAEGRHGLVDCALPDFKVVFDNR